MYYAPRSIVENVESREAVETGPTKQGQPEQTTYNILNKLGLDPHRVPGITHGLRPYPATLLAYPST
jgi:hypothetical protein